MKAFLLVWCRNPANARSSLLTFQTLRTGFPTAEIVVIDNASVIGDQVREHCRRVGASYHRLDREIGHHQYLQRLVHGESSAVLVDPDLVFWQSVEHWDFSGHLVAGRLIPHFQDSFTRCHTVSRLHSSLMWLPDLERLRALFRQRAARFFDPIGHKVVQIGAHWVFWDVMAGLYHLFKAESHAFGDAELDAYDHLFCGTHLDQVIDDLGAESVIARGSRMALEDLASIKGYWRQQQAYFLQRPSPFLDGLLGPP